MPSSARMAAPVVINIPADSTTEQRVRENIIGLEISVSLIKNYQRFKTVCKV
jgi:hypothetical protein